MNIQGYHWLPVDATKHRFVKPLVTVLGNKFDFFCSDSEKDVSRLTADGFWLAKGSYKGRTVAVCWCDFRVKGASFSSASAYRLNAYLELLEPDGIPLIFVLNSLGFRFTEGRNIFSEVFGLVPALDQFRKNNFLITVCQGRCLGIGAILFGLGHYRLAANENATLNLTGPEVFHQFFGEKVNFDGIAGAKTLHQKTSLIHEIRSSISDALSYSVELAVSLQYKMSLPNLTETSVQSGLGCLEKNRQKSKTETIKCLKYFSKTGVELFEGYDDRLKAYVLDFRGNHLAVLINPPGQMNNLFCHRSLEMYHHAIKLFAALDLPLLVMLDTPGIDPRFDGANQRTIEKLIALTEDILHYPMPSIGIINGRGFGGANTLGIPKCYGGRAHYAVAGRSQLDVMHESIMRELLSGSKDLLESWEAMQARQKEDCGDLVELGMLDGIVSCDTMADRIWADLYEPQECKVVSLTF